MFGKRKSKSAYTLPELPESPQMFPSIKDYNRQEDEKQEFHSLPSFPDSPMKMGFSQVAIKDAVENQDSEESLPKLPGINSDKDYKIIEMEEWQPKPNTEMKQSIKTEDEEEIQNLPEDSSGFFPSRLPKIPLVGEEQRHKHFHGHEGPHPIGETNLGNKPIFVKINKFQSAHNSLEEIKEKIDDIDDLIKKIKSIKQQEDQELSAWEREIENIKSRLQSVTAEIFENSYIC